MIKTTTVNEAVLLAGRFDAKGLKITAQGGTPLGSLVNQLGLSQSDILPSTGPDDYTPNTEYIVGLADNFGAQGRGEATRYSVERDALARSIANSVRSHLSYAKNVVTPVIRDFVEKFQKDVAGMSAPTSGGYTIVMDEVPKPLQAAMFIEHLRNYAGMQMPQEPRYTLGAKARTALELRELIAKSIPGLDDEVGEWLASLSDEVLQGVYSTTFLLGGSGRYAGNSVNRYLLCYILAGRLRDNPDEGCGISLAEWNIRCDELHNAAGMQLNNVAEQQDNAVRIGLIITSFTDNSVSVNVPIYKEWLNRGGSDGLLFAATMQKYVPRTMLEIEDKRELLQHTWERHAMLARSAYESNKYMRMKDLLAYRLPVVVRDNAKIIYGNDQSFENLGTHQEFHRLFCLAVNEIRAADFDNIWELGMRLVCCCVFHFTDSYSIMQMRARAIQINPDIKPDDAEFLSRIEYLVTWVADQIDIKSI
jgi:hypothetical protein